MLNSLEELEAKIAGWALARNLLDGSTPKDQFHKLIQECGELSDNMCKGKDVRDDIGDIFVVLTIIAAQYDLTVAECVQVAYDDIKDRKGKMIDGIYIKEKDLE